MKVDIHDYYNNFIRNCKIKLTDYKNNLERVNEEINNVNEELEYLVDKAKELFNINVNVLFYDETTYNKLKKYLTISTDDDKEIIVKLLKYLNNIKLKEECEKAIPIKEKEVSFRFIDYQQYVYNYYKEVHKQILKGYGYKFGGYGMFIILRCVQDQNNKKPIIDYKETRKAKQKLIDSGVRVFTGKELYAMRRNGMDTSKYNYIKYKTYDVFYMLKFFNYTGKKGDVIFKRNTYSNDKYRGLEYQEIVDKYIKEENDIYNIQMCLRAKLSLLLLFDPTKYVNFNNVK